MNNRVVLYRVIGENVSVGIIDWHRIAKNLEGYGFHFEKKSAQLERAADLGSKHAFEKDVCIFCGSDVGVASQPCPSRYSPYT